MNISPSSSLPRPFNISLLLHCKHLGEHSIVPSPQARVDLHNPPLFKPSILPAHHSPAQPRSSTRPHISTHILTHTNQFFAMDSTSFSDDDVKMFFAVTKLCMEKPPAKELATFMNLKEGAT